MGRSTREVSAVRHARRYAPFYAFGVLALLAIAVTPTVEEPASDAPVALGAGGASAQPAPAGDALAAAGAPAEAGGHGRAAAGGGPGEAGGPPTRGGTRTRAGFECRPGVRQLPWSEYAAPCRPAFSGDNGGATARGVSEDAIRVVLRSFATDGDSNALSAVIARAGVDRVENQRRQAVFIEYFNEVFELYGRRVEVVPFRSNASPFDEANGRGREQACADATRIAEELQAFAVMPADGIAFGPFTECAAAHHLLQPIGAYGFPQEFYARLHPYVWGVPMTCTRISSLYAEYIVKRLDGRPARHARDPLYQRQPRRLGIVRPDIEYYFPCNRLLEDELRRHGVEIVSRFDYVLDPATLPAQMTRAVVQFKSDGVTSLLLGADFLTVINLTQAAASQGWGPEWVLSGAGLQDAYPFARLYDQDVVDGHMFGMSQIGSAEIALGPDSELARSYKEATGEDFKPPEPGNYHQLMHMFNQLQAAGPNLTPRSVAEGTFALPPSGSRHGTGVWSFRTLANGEPGFQHTAATDVREVFWDRRATGPDGRPGDFVGVLAARFGVGEWPAGDPQR